MKERGIIFSGPMVRAILEGRKSQTRRVMKNPPTLMDKVYAKLFRKDFGGRKCPYGIPGDRLYVRETHYRWGKWIKNGLTKTGRQKWRFKGIGRRVAYIDDPPGVLVKVRTVLGWHKRPSIFMPKWASRIWLEVVGVRAERIQEISEEDAIAEGLTEHFWPDDLHPEARARVEGKRYWEHVIVKRGRKCSVWDSPVKAFRELWDDINGKRPGCAWKDNPWVWMIEFKPRPLRGMRRIKT